MIGKHYSILVILWVVVLSTACASYTQETQRIRGLFKMGNYKTALEDLEKSDLKDSSSSHLLYLLEKAMILDRMGELKKSQAALKEADRLVDKLYTVSISKTALSFVHNDSSADYSGEDYEKVAIHTQLAMSFIEQGDYQSARVEAAKINNMLYEINQGYDEGNRNTYGEDAFARYLSAVIYESRQEWDSAIIDYRKALKLYAGPYSKFGGGNMPENLIVALHRLYLKRDRQSDAKVLEKTYPKLTARSQKRFDKEKKSKKSYGEIIVVHEMGNIAYKTAQEFIFPIGGQIVRFSFPVISGTSGFGYSGKTGFTVIASKKTIKADIVQDMTEIARVTLEERRARMVAKQTARLILKGQVAEQARQNFGELAGLATNLLMGATETADTRSWTLQPEAFAISRYRVPVGNYKIKIITNGKVSDIVTAKVERDKAVIFRGVNK